MTTLASRAIRSQVVYAGLYQNSQACQWWPDVAAVPVGPAASLVSTAPPAPMIPITRNASMSQTQRCDNLPCGMRVFAIGGEHSQGQSAVPSDFGPLPENVSALANMGSG